MRLRAHTHHIWHSIFLLFLLLPSIPTTAAPTWVFFCCKFRVTVSSLVAVVVVVVVVVVDRGVLSKS